MSCEPWRPDRPPRPRPWRRSAITEHHVTSALFPVFKEEEKQASKSVE